MGEINYKWPFSIAMLVYQRVKPRINHQLVLEFFPQYDQPNFGQTFQTHVLNGENEASDHGPVPNFEVKMIPSSFYVEMLNSFCGLNCFAAQTPSWSEFQQQSKKTAERAA